MGPIGYRISAHPILTIISIVCFGGAVFVNLSYSHSTMPCSILPMHVSWSSYIVFTMVTMY